MLKLESFELCLFTLLGSGKIKELKFPCTNKSLAVMLTIHLISWG